MKREVHCWFSVKERTVKRIDLKKSSNEDLVKLFSQVKAKAAKARREFNKAACDSLTNDVIANEDFEESDWTDFVEEPLFTKLTEELEERVIEWE